MTDDRNPPGLASGTTLLTTLSMAAFAANSLLCRLALRETHIDAASFTTIRLASGALVLWIIVRLRHGASGSRGSWPSALALFAYAAAFSFAYQSLPAGSGALILFGAVQATMIGFGLWHGERMGMMQSAGLLLAASGLVGLMLPGLAAPPLSGALLMTTAGIAWGIYSLRGRGSSDATINTAGNFMRSLPFCAALTLATLPAAEIDQPGTVYAIASGAIASGLGYAVWYTALPRLRATTAATVQLSVPVIAAVGGIVLLSEPLTLRLVLAAAAVLGGIAMVISGRHGRSGG
ncbi:Threonine/homoserine efflux transporter RhtA [Noviherbaspirillum humi]|uniref:Threonine/homoserine efflux transporter RhtA n=1 Tax=Noviherbaspirillum humi TaxID=1688639 RepID=A0A239HHU1_9BURK|nr:DMT family transporter [Noviherbaspirillum humi]SNS79834.1 Threonine/homoserine efflux transporter RhtA [Noviherbaspirillum humi]